MEHESKKRTLAETDAISTSTTEKRISGDLPRNSSFDTLEAIDDVRISEIRPMLPPALLLEELPLTDIAHKTISRTRKHAADILHGRDDRILVIVGPCSIHDEKAALDYARRLKELADEMKQDLLIIMRVYFEKPRTVVGWKGLINDPHLDGTFKINTGLRLARKLLLDINNMGLAAGCEFLDTITPQFFADLVSWGAIGARTTESQVHRQLSSGLSMPVGFKNSTNGSIAVAVDAIRAAAHPHCFLSVTKQGLCAIVKTKGNADCHVILRGSNQGPNYEKSFIDAAAKDLKKVGLAPRVMVDCSHDNSRKDYRNQPKVLDDIINQIEQGGKEIFGVMIESHITAGKQEIHPEGLGKMTYGQSITDGCVGWRETVSMLEKLCVAVKKRRTNPA
eukprot:TRINITY_DN3620_c0_g1_i1.p1 TRINITY_DN3620_c0_g1~~TRINITY_DN3620_c0_g1_i1.p1  ORF type:complete len:393 (-),score=91.63 TRINITY_DN3620_c0_g1_i1:139-1317(-)